jgi:hypothetical protein
LCSNAKCVIKPPLAPIATHTRTSSALHHTRIYTQLTQVHTPKHCFKVNALIRLDLLNWFSHFLMSDSLFLKLFNISHLKRSQNPTCVCIYIYIYIYTNFGNALTICFLGRLRYLRIINWTGGSYFNSIYKLSCLVDTVTLVE